MILKGIILRMKESTLLNPVAVSLSALLFAVAAHADSEDEIVNLPLAAYAWEQTQEGVGFASLMGDRFAGPYMAMVRLPAGLVSPAHTKSSSMFGVVVAGTMTHVGVDEDVAAAPELRAGSFYRIPAGLGHVSRCVSDTECITFLYQDGKFDFLPIGQ